MRACVHVRILSVCLFVCVLVFGLSTPVDEHMRMHTIDCVSVCYCSYIMHMLTYLHTYVYVCTRFKIDISVFYSTGTSVC